MHDFFVSDQISCHSKYQAVIMYKGGIFVLKIGIICAGDREAAPFLPHIENCTITEKAMLKFHEGTVYGLNVVLLFSGVCKVNAAIATQILIDCFDVNTIINVGTCGGMTAELDVFDTVISAEVAYYDVDEKMLTDFHPWMKTAYFSVDQSLFKLAKNLITDSLEDRKIVTGRMVTGEAFVADSLRDAIVEKYNPLSADMETGSVAHVCYVNHVPFIAIRTITDTPEHSGIENFEANCEKASEISKNVTMRLLLEMKSHCTSGS